MCKAKYKGDTGVVSQA